MEQIEQNALWIMILVLSSWIIYLASMLFISMTKYCYENSSLYHPSGEVKIRKARYLKTTTNGFVLQIITFFGSLLILSFIEVVITVRLLGFALIALPMVLMLWQKLKAIKLTK